MEQFKDKEQTETHSRDQSTSTVALRQQLDKRELGAQNHKFPHTLILFKFHLFLLAKT